MPGARAVQNLQMPQPWDWRTDQVGKRPAVAREVGGGGGGVVGVAGRSWNWLMHNYVRCVSVTDQN